MLIIGITGPSGTGKSFATKILEDNGFVILDEDKIAREVVEIGEPCLEDLKDTFGMGIINPYGGLDREALAGIVFGNKDSLQKLNSITHPYIMGLVRERINKLKKDGVKFMVIDAPALFESEEDDICDVIWRYNNSLSEEQIREWCRGYV